MRQMFQVGQGLPCAAMPQPLVLFSPKIVAAILCICCPFLLHRCYGASLTHHLVSTAHSCNIAVLWTRGPLWCVFFSFFPCHRFHAKSIFANAVTRRLGSLNEFLLGNPKRSSPVAFKRPLYDGFGIEGNDALDDLDNTINYELDQFRSGVSTVFSHV